MGSRRLILLGGSAGAGKTTTARALAGELGAGWLQVDTIWLALQDAALPGSEAHTILRIDERIREANATVDELVDHQLAASELVCAAMRRAFMFELDAHGTVVADGAWLLPRFMKELVIDNTNISGAVLHEEDREGVQRAMSARRTAGFVAPWHELGATVSWQYGNRVAEAASRLSIPVISARPRETLLERVRAAVE